MNNLSREMQERLDKWRKNTIAVPSSEKVKENKGRSSAKFVGKHDYGDVNSLEELEEEHRRSQTRK